MDSFNDPKHRLLHKIFLHLRTNVRKILMVYGDKLLDDLTQIANTLLDENKHFFSKADHQEFVELQHLFSLILLLCSILQNMI